MQRVRIRGSLGEVRWAYHRAAELRAWEIHAEPTGGTLTAEVVSHDAFTVSQQPLTFVVARHGGQLWRWPILSLQIADRTLTASLGPQE